MDVVNAAAVSPDLRWLAVSTAGRGAIWSLSSPQRQHMVRHFQGAYFGDDSALYVDLPGLGGQQRSIARIDLSTFETTSARPVDETGAARTQYFVPEIDEGKHGEKLSLVALDAGANIEQDGQYLVSEIAGGQHDKKLSLVVRDVRTGNMLWTRAFQEAPPTYFQLSPSGNRLVLVWMADQRPTKEEIAKHKALKIAHGKVRLNAALAQVLDAETGNLLGEVLGDILPGEPLRVAGPWLFAMLGQQTSVYSIPNGKLQSTVRGRFLAASAFAGFFAARASDSSVELYDLKNLEKHASLSFASEVAFAHFSDDGKRLFVLTRDQRFYILDVGVLAKPGGKEPAD